jgi:hypothetical protein
VERPLLPIFVELLLKELQELPDPVWLPLADRLIEPLQTLADSGARGRPVRNANRLDGTFAGYGFKLCFRRIMPHRIDSASVIRQWRRARFVPSLG